MKMERVVIFANGEMGDPGAVRKMVRPGDFLVAADGGLGHLEAVGLTPAVLLGDLDSIDSVTPERLAALEASGVRIIRHPAEKDETDLELALHWVIVQGYCQIRIVGALGGRLDHMLANLYMLAHPDLQDCDVRLDDGRVEIFLITSLGQILGEAGDTVSLLPFFGPARDIHTTGLYYPLAGETLYPHRTRGISNVLVSTQAQVTLSGGMLLCIHTRQE